MADGTIWLDETFINRDQFDIWTAIETGFQKVVDAGEFVSNWVRMLPSR